MKIITLDTIKSFNPCTSGWRNLKTNYPEFKGTPIDFLKLELIPYEDKIWLMWRLDLDSSIWKRWGLACASSQSDNSDDPRVESCLLVVERFLNGEATQEELNLAESAAWSAAGSAAWSAESAARSAAWLARSAARSAAESAARSAAESAARLAAGSAAWSAESAAWSAESAARLAAEELNILFLIEELEEWQ